MGLIRYTPRRNGEGHISPGAGVLTNCHCYSTILVNNLTIVNKRVGGVEGEGLGYVSMYSFKAELQHFALTSLFCL